MNNNNENKERKIIKERTCRQCGKLLPAVIRYEFAWCWMCLRDIWEVGYPRYYVASKPQRGITYWEEVQTLRGINGFTENNQPLIKEKMIQAQKELNNSENKTNEF